MFGLGAGEILLILAFALIFIGPKKLPELARNLGKGIREFQKAKDDLMTQVNTEVDSVKQETLESTSMTGVDLGDEHQDQNHEEEKSLAQQDAEQRQEQEKPKADSQNKDEEQQA